MREARRDRVRNFVLQPGELLESQPAEPPGCGPASEPAVDGARRGIPGTSLKNPSRGGATGPRTSRKEAQRSRRRLRNACGFPAANCRLEPPVPPPGETAPAYFDAPRRPRVPRKTLQNKKYSNPNFCSRKRRRNFGCP